MATYLTVELPYLVQIPFQSSHLIYIYIYIYSRYLLILISHVRVRPGNNPTLLSKNICVICVVPRTVQNGAFSDVITQVAEQWYPISGKEGVQENDTRATLPGTMECFK